nr:putative disease resistance protein At1g50180 [Coffea arabica]
MADAILSFAVENIGKLIIEEGNFLQGASEQVRLLRDDLERIKIFLRYADTKQSARDTVHQWVPQFRAVAYDASDLVEDYALRLSISSNRGFTSTLKRIACMATEGNTHHDLGVEIQSLRTRISNLTKNFGEYGHVMARMEEGELSAPSRQQQLRHTYSFVADEDVVELPNDVQVLVKYLLNEVAEHKISVASIFGMGGIGKTTLARKVYHHGRLKDYFKGFAWVCVSQQWQPKDLLQRILLKLTPQNRKQIMTSKEDELARLLQQHLRARRCLIVLDDIWSTEAWDCLKEAISVSEHGSKILLTTRNRDVVAHVDPNGYHHQLHCLTKEESWELLRKKSLWARNSAGCEDLDKMEELGKKMLKYSMVVLGGILRTKKTLREWNEVHENIKSYLARGEKIGKEGEVLKILAYSYYDLPWQLKPCFLYLGKFKEDSDIGVESLYQMWIGEGMIFENDRREQETMVDVAERYLEELANRCMVEIKVHKEGKRTVTRLESCRLHDLMRDLCLAKAKDENLYKVVDRSTSQDSTPAIEAQYGLVLRLLPRDRAISKYNFPPKEQIKHLRSFLCDSLVSQVKNLKMLRVLAILYFDMASQNWRWWDAHPKLQLSKQLEILESFDNRFCYPKEGFGCSFKVLFSRNIHELEIGNSLCKKLLDYQSHIFLDPAGLTQLELYYTYIEEDPIGILEKLPNLRILELGSYSFLGREMICHSMGFPQLKILGFIVCVIYCSGQWKKGPCLSSQVYGLGCVKNWK